MNTMMDTLTAVQTLRDAGVEESQAKAHAQVVVQIVREIQGDLATKADIAGLKSATGVDFSGLESAFSRLESKIRTVQWMFAIGVAILALMMVLMKILF